MTPSFCGFVSRVRFDDSDSNLIASAELWATPDNMFVGVIQCIGASCSGGRGGGATHANNIAIALGT